MTGDLDFTRKNTHSKKSKAHPSEVVFQAIEVAFHVLIWFSQVIYYIFEDIYRIFHPKKLKPVDKDVVLITGTGHGIGKELAIKYAKAGGKVVCLDLCEDNNDDTVKIIKERYNKQAYSYKCDVSRLEDVESTAEKIRKDVGDVTIVIANAGILYSRQMQSYTPIEIKKIMDTNVMQLLWLIHVYLPVMTRNNYGHIVGISSVAGLYAGRNMMPYSGSKYAVRGIMEGLREELRSDKSNKVKTTVVYPYMVNTGFIKVPRGRFPLVLRALEPEEVAEATMIAQRMEIEEISVPGSLRVLLNILRILPRKAFKRLIDLLDAGVEPDPVGN